MDRTVSNNRQHAYRYVHFYFQGTILLIYSFAQDTSLNFCRLISYIITCTYVHICITNFRKWNAFEHCWFYFLFFICIKFDICILKERTNTIKKYRVSIIWLQLICHKFRKPASRNEYIELSMYNVCLW